MANASAGAGPGDNASSGDDDGYSGYSAANISSSAGTAAGIDIYR